MTTMTKWAIGDRIRIVSKAKHHNGEEVQEFYATITGTSDKYVEWTRAETIRETNVLPREMGGRIVESGGFIASLPDTVLSKIGVFRA